MFSLFKRKGKSYQERRKNDFATAKGAIKKGDKLSDRDKKMIAVGPTHVHIQQQQAAMYKNPEKFKPETLAKHGIKANASKSKPASKPAAANDFETKLKNYMNSPSNPKNTSKKK